VNLYNKCCGLLVVLLALGTALNAQVTGSIHTGQTTLVLQAGREEPRLVSLQSGKFPAWPNGISERLIGSVEEGGRTVSLHWKLDERDSHITERVATFVYQSAPPRLRLTWKWEARAEYGPVEHSITIENLSSSEIWLPLQDSLLPVPGGGEPSVAALVHRKGCRQAIGGGYAPSARPSGLSLEWQVQHLRQRSGRTRNHPLVHGGARQSHSGWLVCGNRVQWTHAFNTAA